MLFALQRWHRPPELLASDQKIQQGHQLDRRERTLQALAPHHAQADQEGDSKTRLASRVCKTRLT